MVVFTCNHCGESLQKPRVEKHYQTSCRNAISVTCMDCFKDFKLQEYAAHTKCITEEQRYSAKGTVQGGAKKGEIKQLSWVAQINNILETEKNLKPNEKELLEFISKNENVPRKKNKFINFMKSSSGGRVNIQNIEAVWNIMEAQKNKMVNKEEKDNTENKEPKQENENAKDTEETKDKKSKKKKKSSEENVEVQNSEIVETEETSKKSKKKKKSSEENIEVQNSGIMETEETNKKSKKKKRKAETIENSEDIKEEVIIEEKPSKKKKRKVEAVEEKPEEIVTEPENSKKKKKKNKKNSQNTTEEKVEEIVQKDEGTKKNKKKNKSEAKIQENGVAEVKSEPILENGEIKKKKKKNKGQEQHGTTLNGHANDEEMTTKVVTEKKKKKKDKENSAKSSNTDLDSSMNDFSWQREILAILKDTKRMPKHDLQKAVAKRFKKVRGEPPNMTQIKLFQRKLNKLTNVKCENDIVMLQ